MAFTTKSLAFICSMFYLSSFLHGSYSLSRTEGPASSKFLEPYRIYVTNRDVPTLVVQCPPDGTPKGPSLLWPGSQITWKFRRNLFESTRYDCNFYWLADDREVVKSITVAVFNKKIAEMCGRNLFHVNRCYWMVTKVGFYLSKNNGTFPSVYDWQVVYVWDTV